MMHPGLDPAHLAATPSPSRVPQGRSPLAPVALLRRSPHGKGGTASPSLGGGGGLLAASSPSEHAEDLVRALRRDLLEVQSFIDAQSSRGVLSYGMRKLEAELLGISGSAESQAVRLLAVLQAKAQELADVMPPGALEWRGGGGAGTAGAAAAAADRDNAAFLAAAARSSPVVTPSALAAPPILKPLLDVARALYAATLSQQPQQQQQQLRQQQTHQPRGGFSGSQSPPPPLGQQTPMDEAMLSSAALGGSGSGGAAGATIPRLEIESNASSGDDATRRASEAANAAPQSPLIPVPQQPAAASTHLPAAAVVPSRPLTGDSLAHLRSLGIEVGEAEAQAPDINVIIARVAAVARNVLSTKGKMQKHLDESRDILTQRQRQHQLELDAMAQRLADKDGELQDLKRQLASSRFAANQLKSLTTVHDAPMSFEVERQYQRDLHRCNLRIAELEADYKKLFDDGIDDRQRVKDLTAETHRLREEIAKMNRLAAKLEAEKEENHSLFVGVSKTRGEEARMCAVAVKQLEGRVAELLQQLRDAEQSSANLSSNLAAVFGDFLAQSEALRQLQAAHADLQDTFTDYRAVYNPQLVERLERTQRQLLQALDKSDEQEGTITILRQQIDDHEHQRSVTVQETQKLMEKFKSSTEFKLLGVRAPDETKQLAVRLVVLQSDKEKKESSTATQHAERLALFRTRAEKEVKDRCDRRRGEANLISAKSTEDLLKGKVLQRERQRAQELEVAKKAERPRAETIKGEYLAECARRVVTFTAFYDERYPPDDY